MTVLLAKVENSATLVSQDEEKNCINKDINLKILNLKQEYIEKDKENQLG